MSEHWWEGEFRNAASGTDRKFKRVIRYVNDRIVPEVRSEAKVALRDISRGLHRLADALEPRQMGSEQTVGKGR